MQIPIEVLFQKMMRTDSGAGVRQKALLSPAEINAFGKLLDEKRTTAESQIATGESMPVKKPAETDASTTKPQEPDDNIDENMAIAAGVMGNQNQVVFILEGEKESATTPEISVGTVAEVDVNITNTADIPAEPGTPAFNAGPGQGAAEASDATETNTQPAAAGTAETNVKAGQMANADDKAAADANKAPDAGANGSGNGIGATGDVTARKPVTGTSEQQENGGNSSEFSKHGDLSPLENENNTVPVKGQKEKTYSELESAANKTDDAAPVNNAAMPLAEGIKPERFQADQQMKQAVASAPVRTENLFDEMVSRIETMNSDNRSTMAIQLKPEFLGEVALEIAMDVAGLHVKISAANSDVRGLINGQINALIESLESKGIEVVEVEVTYTGVNNGAFNDSNKEQAHQDRSRRSYRVDGVEDSAAYYAALSFSALDYYLDAGVSSVEYQA